jgi:hypothetical protein
MKKDNKESAYLFQPRKEKQKIIRQKKLNTSAFVLFCFVLFSKIIFEEREKSDAKKQKKNLRFFHLWVSLTSQESCFVIRKKNKFAFYTIFRFCSHTNKSDG